MKNKLFKTGLVLMSSFTLGMTFLPLTNVVASEEFSKETLLQSNDELNINSSFIENSFEISNNRIFSGYSVTQTRSGQIERYGPNSVKFDGKINGKRHVGTLYFRYSTLNKKNWTYTWTYYGNVSPK